MDAIWIYRWIYFFVFFTVGVISVRISGEEVKRYQQEAKQKGLITRSLLNKVLKPLRYSNTLIGKSVEKDSVLLFGVALTILFLYYGIISLIFFFMKALIYVILFNKIPAISLIEGFSLLLGAGVISFPIWLKRFKDKQDSERKLKDSIRVIWLFLVFFFWFGLEVVYLVYTQEYAFAPGHTEENPLYTPFLRLFMIAMGIYLMIVVFFLIIWGVRSKTIKLLLLIPYPLLIFYILAVSAYFATA
jgi:hypothetical protein